LRVRLPVTWHGAREISLAAVVSLGLAGALWAAWPPLAALPAVGFLYVLAFFRDPLRVPEELPLASGALLAPADGRVDFVGEADEPLLGGRCLKISIFLSVFDVHMNRAPCDGTVERIEYRPGEYLDARTAECSARNEANVLVLASAGAAGRPARVLVRQISGAIARRIVCTAREGQRLAAGERFGMIKFGSRTDLCLPPEAAARLTVRPGQHVAAGRTVLGVLP
jgi:phosphatidylserine decarboxylase